MSVQTREPSAPPAAPSRRLAWFEVGRGLAALGVVIAHYNPAPDTGLFVLGRDLGIYAVEFFFTLSGFIIFFVHGHEFGQPHALGRYGWRRLCRVLPTYWIMLTLALAFNQTVQNPGARIHLTLAECARQFLLLPNAVLVIGPGWTLRHELLFYAMFATIILSRRIGLAVFGLWMAACLGHLVIWGLPPGQIWTPAGIFFHHYNIDFLFGMAVALAARGRGLTALSASLGGAGVALLLAAAASRPGGMLLDVIGHKALFAGILGGLVVLSGRRVRAPAWGVRLGAASYALYISHITIGVAFNGGLKKLGLHDAIPMGVRFLLDVAVALVFASLFFMLVEKPILRRLYALWDDRAPRSRAAPVGSVAADQGV